MTDKNTASVKTAANGAFVEAERHEPRPVECAMIVDLTASRDATRAKFIQDFTQGSEAFEKLIGQVSAIGNVGITLIVHNGNGVQKVGRFESPVEMAKALSEIPCVASNTQIAKSMDLIEQGIDFVIVNGDTTDGDKLSELVEKAKALGIPVIPLLEKTDGSSGTKVEHIKTLEKMGEASGVPGGPFSYQTRMSLLDFVAVSAAAVQGPAAVEALKATNEVSQEAWDALPESARTAIAEAAREEPVAATAPAAVVPAAFPSMMVENTGIKGVAIGRFGHNANVAVNIGGPVEADAVPAAQSAKAAHAAAVVPAFSVQNAGASGVAIGQIGDGATVTINIAQPAPVAPTLVVVETPAAAQTVQGKKRGAKFWVPVAAVAAIAGGVVGYELALSNVFGDPLRDLRVATGGNVTFETGSATLTPQSVMVLDNIAQKMRTASQPVCLVITGNASRTGPDAKNQSLSLERATAVAHMLQYGFNVPASALQVKAQGVTVPLGGPLEYNQRVSFEPKPGVC